MKNFQEKKLRVVFIMMLIIFFFFSFPARKKKEKTYKEYDVKAACLLKFLRYTDFPDKAFSGPDAPFVIGIIGEDPFGDKLDNTTKEAESVNNRKIHIERFKNSATLEPLKKCHILFISSSIPRPEMKKLLDSLKEDPLLTVGDVKGFGHLGGIINFVIKEYEVKFEINKAAADTAGIKIRASLLKLAIKIIGTDHAK